MMAELMLVSDDMARAERRFRSLERISTLTVLDLYEPCQRLGGTGIVVSDVSDLSADAVSRLRTLLSRIRPTNGPFIFIAHGNGPRVRAYAEALGATAVVSATDTDKLTALVERLVVEGGSVPLSARVHATRARDFLRETFRTGILTPEEVTNGADAVAWAIGSGGVYDWIRTVREFDDATHQHILLVAGIAAAFAGTLGLSAIDRHKVVKAALLHDVGKTRIPTAILNKPGKLDAAELAVMRTHAVEGHAMLAAQGFEDAILRVARSHHEMLDGSGYPDGLHGDEIPDLVRLITVCDIYGALIERRPYRAPMSNVAAFAVLDRMDGRLDPDLVRAFKPVVTSPSEANGSDAVARVGERRGPA
ncbi:HD domain-containing protein [Methylobacterium sp. E-005]|uniref:HD-GYP domain-containing protein n=1 Tax=Methylobacterium sp. E-005 TaxID=2836549 RepID=UPI001FBB46E9|nr:HD domain-containing phosphohydrolase [Methylobacterium sp. E-005]MCJ2089763.1 HD domain-containing protein [Methylobacterium sp. E-005]